MTERELFGALVRWLGALACLYGLYLLLYGALKFLGTSLSSHLSVATDLVFGLGLLALGLVVMRFSGVLARFAYGRLTAPD